MVGLAAVLRLYRIAEYTAFQGDQGVDALAARRLLVDYTVPWEGPATSVGGVHLGPAYYYFLALPMLVDWLDPLADAVCVAVLGAAAVGVVFVLAQRWFGFWTAVAAGALYAMSPAAIVAARSAWNPSPAPVFTALAVLGLDGAWRTGDGRWLLLVGAALGFLIQLHYFALAIVFVCGVTMVFLVRRQPALRVWAVASLGIFVALLAPLLVHECLNDFPNLRAAMALAGSGRAGVVQISAPRRAYEVFALGLVGTFLASNVEVIAASVSFLILALLGLGLARDRARRFPCVVIGGLLLGTVVQALLYRGTIFEHYLVPISPVLYLGLAAMLGLIPRTPLPRFVATGTVLCLAGLNLFSSPLRSPPDNQLAHTRTVAQLIADVAGHQPFELWLVAGGESDGAYRFWLERMGKPPVPADGPVAPQMFIVCRRASCDPAHAQDQPGDVWSSARLAWRAQVADDEILQLVLGHILDP